MSNLKKGSILFSKLRQSLARGKSTYVYEVDKTASQKWVESRVANLKQQQKMFSENDGIPLWWKTPMDKALTTVAFAGTMACFLISMSKCYKTFTGK